MDSLLDFFIQDSTLDFLKGVILGFFVGFFSSVLLSRYQNKGQKDITKQYQNKLQVQNDMTNQLLRDLGMVFLDFKKPKN